MPIINQVVSGGGSAPATQYGVNFKGWCGDVNNGQIRTDQAVGTLSMPGLTYIAEYLFKYKFKGSTGLVGTVNLPDVVDISDFGMYEAFANTNITGVNLGNNGYIMASGLEGAFKGTQITTITINCGLGFSQSSFNDMCKNCSQLRHVYLNIPASLFTDYADSIGSTSIEDDVIPGVFYNMISGCTNCTVHFIQDIWQDWNQWYTDIGETPPYSTAQDWGAAILPYLGGGTGNSVVFDINPS